jgi:hypothetical protein
MRELMRSTRPCNGSGQVNAARRQRRLRLLPALLLILCVAPAQADSIDINLNDDAIRAVYAHELSGTGYGSPQLDFGVLYNDDRRHTLAHVGLRAVGYPTPLLEGGLGGRLYYADLRRDEVGALALGGHLRFFATERLALVGEAHFAPRVVTFLDGRNFRDLEARIEYHLMETGAVYVGHRRVRTEVEGPVRRRTVDDGLHVGLRFRF